jgi:putative intracellular protease/amidase
MKLFVRLAALIVLGSGLVLTAVPASPSSGNSPARYVCDPCNSPCDHDVYDKPGTCPKCGMPLIEESVAAARAAAAAKRLKVGILLFDGVEIIDFTGPWEMFGAANFQVYTVAERRDAVTTAMGMTVQPGYTFADAPQPDVLLIPGGGVRAAQSSAPTLDWIRRMNAHTVHTLSVCNGAFILASTGLLDGLAATTTSGNIERMRATFPKVKVVDDRRFVDNGRIITTGGLSAGIDGALHVIARMLGEGTAQQVALGEEYDWRPEGGLARGTLADRLIPDVDLDGIGDWKILSTRGGTDRWDLVVQGTSTLSATDVMGRIGRSFTTKGGWTSAGAPTPHSPSSLRSDWTFSGRDGRPWTGTLTLDTVAGKDHEYTAKLSIARAGLL